MISDEDIDALPEDSEAAFVQYEALLREVVRVKNSDLNSAGWDIEREYVAHVLAFLDARGVPLDLPRNPPRNDGSFADWYREFVRAIDYYKAVARLQLSARKKANVAIISLDRDFKTQIGGHLSAIRKIVANAEVSENKRDAIYRRINILQEEVDRDRTRTEAIIGLWLDVSSAIGKGAKNLDPAIERLERIMKVFAKAKDENEQKALEAPPERKRLAPPRSSEDTASHRTEELDDEIPF